MRPTQMMVFEALYRIAAADGREEALFGSSMELARPAFEKTLIGALYPNVYLEFPLSGRPCFDLLSGVSHVGPGDRFAPGAGYGYQAAYDLIGPAMDNGLICGFELDCSRGETERAGFYLQHLESTELVAPFLESVGEGCRQAGYDNVVSRMPHGWPCAYTGLFPGREGTPLRIGGCLSPEAQRACAEDPAELGRAFEAVGFDAWDAPMLERCSQLMQLAPLVDYQFDVLRDGTLGDTFGLSPSFTHMRPQEARASMEGGYGAQVLGLLEEWGLADGRWRHIAGLPCVRMVPFAEEDGGMGLLMLCIRLTYAKVKFVGASCLPAKFYIGLRAEEVGASHA